MHSYRRPVTALGESADGLVGRLVAHLASRDRSGLRTARFADAGTPAAHASACHFAAERDVAGAA